MMNEYPGLDFSFQIKDLPDDYLDRLGGAVEDCQRIMSLVSRYDILSKPEIRLTVWTDPISADWPLAVGRDNVLRRKHRETKAVNVLGLYDDIAARTKEGRRIPLTIDEICRCHERLMRDIPQKSFMPPGRFRKGWMKVGDIKVGVCCKDIQAYMERYLSWLSGPAFDTDKGSPLGNAFIKAIVAHCYFVNIHPFYDGNGSIARLLQYIILRNAGVPASLAHLLGNHYNETREQYTRISNLARARGDITIFIDYALSGLSRKMQAHLTEVIRRVPRRIRMEVSGKRSLVSAGFTILEILAVLAVLSILIGIAIPRIQGMRDQANIIRTKAELKTIQAALEAYRNNHGTYLETGDRQELSFLTAVDSTIISADLVNDPWGTPYSFWSDGETYTLVSSGPPPYPPDIGSKCGVMFNNSDVPPVNQEGCRCIYATSTLPPAAALPN